ncbi:MAG: hypothetical protein DHS20C18_36440 [Saprospiraceae bacterium]|nr:MAG: hypothetical protein DHS20C18_36440 [Saprospiraceae bacterium]
MFSKISVLLIVFCCAILANSCHVERFRLREFKETGVRKINHSLWFTGEGKSELNYYFTDSIVAKKKAIPFEELNFNNFPASYSGFITIVSEDNNFIANLYVNSLREAEEDLILTGSFSTLNKRKVSPLEISIPYQLIDEASYYVSDTSIIVDPKFVVHSLIQTDTLQEEDKLQDSILTVNYKYPITVSNIQVFENTDFVSMLSGEINLPNDGTLKFYAQSDPLPLIPILIAGVASGGAWLIKKWYDSPDKPENKGQVAVKVEKTDQKD